MTEAMTFGERLRELREQAGLSQEALARAAGISTSTVSKMEQRTIDPSWSTVRALARALGVRCEAFETDTPDAGPADQPAAKKPRKRQEK
jgi:transcriptional regulator with XRE-family HTH domain